MKEIRLSNGKTVFVDDADYSWLSQWEWHYHNMGYAIRHSYINKKNVVILMHAVIMNTPSGLVTDHIDGNKLNNQRDNLRICTQAENSRNKRMQCNNTSGFIGVTWDKSKRKWLAQISVDKKHINLGRYKNIDDAVSAYNKAAMKYHKEFSRMK